MDKEWKLPDRWKGSLYDEDAHPLEPLDDHDMPIPKARELFTKFLETGDKAYLDEARAVARAVKNV